MNIPEHPTSVPAGSTSNDDHSSRRPPRNRNRRPRKPAENATQSTGTAEGAPAAEATRSQVKPNRPPQRRNPPNQSRESPGQGEGASQKPKQPRQPKKKDGETQTQNPGPSRRHKFQGKLTTPGDQGASSKEAEAAAAVKPSEKYRSNLPQGDDLTSTLIRSLSTPPYPDCPICFSSIHPAQPTWSCSPTTPVIPSAEGQVHYCWTSFHTKCIKSWAAKSVKDVAEAWRARGEHDRVGDWRCPGCQAKREIVPSGYRCFCGSTPEPKLTRLSTPHSCGQPCSRVRESGCGHPCPLLCHPGPCPPCQVVTQLECYCPRRISHSFRCGVDATGKGKGKRDLSCRNVCGRMLGCGKHSCPAVCHEGECEKCPVKETVKCWCGKDEKEVDCGAGTPIECFVEGETPWIGRYGCDDKCQRAFDCGIHHCEKPCHPPSQKPAVCPRSPSKVIHCPCGKCSIAPPGVSDPSQYHFPARESCEAPIPSCSSPCLKSHPQCSHPCEAKCHPGPCPPCKVVVTRPCRCGSSTRQIPCHEAYSKLDNGDIIETEILCDRPCAAMRACGRHQCRRICCPLASLAAANKKGKKRATQNEVGIGEERGGLHECDLVCSRMLSCGNHRCEERDHKGPCPPCLRSSFEEMFCPCGRTVFEPPIPCGTRIQCSYPCPRPPPPCGHPVTPHSCHDDSQPCPPCPHLTPKQCACGKKEMPNIKCSLERDKVSCGTVCGKLMSCGFHHCDRICHSGECGTCVAPCGKSRKSCLPAQHPCTRPCHAPSACPETEPCEASIWVTCPCGRIKLATQCGRNSSQPSGRAVSPPKCTTECSIAQRNAKLAEALGINPEARGKGEAVSYSDEVVAFARANAKFVPLVEKAFADFVTSDKRNQVLPHMPPEKRKFVHDLAQVYRMDTQLIDQEPQRSVQLIRRIDTRIPSPVLSAYIASLAPAPNFGRLADLRAIKSGSPTPRPGGTSTSAWPAASSSSRVPTPPLSRPASTRGWAAATAGVPSRSLGSVPPAVSAATSSAVAPAATASSARSGRGYQPEPRRDFETNTSEEQKPVIDNWEDDL